MIEIHLCEDLDYLQAVLIDDPEMFERSSDDYTKVDCLACMPKEGKWLECRRDGDRVGLCYVKFDTNSALKAHIHIPKQHRGKGTQEIGRALLKWMVENAPKSMHKINTRIPSPYKDVIRYAQSLGFQKEGIDRKSIMKNGELIDRVYMGICFDEVKL